MNRWDMNTTGERVGASDSMAGLYVFLDLENLAFLGSSLHPLAMTCRMHGMEFRSYCSPEHEWADRATHTARSNEKEAADVRMVFDAAQILSRIETARILLVTDDLFGRTLAAEDSRVAHVRFDDPLPLSFIGICPSTAKTGVKSLKDFFSERGVFRERHRRTPSVSTRTSRSRTRESSRSHGRTRASWSRAASTVAPRNGRESEKLELQSEIDRLTAELACVRIGRRVKGPRKWPLGQKPSTGKLIGTIIKWNERGFGFIAPHSGRNSTIFVHISDIVIDRTTSGQRAQLHNLLRWDVEFRTSRSAKGLKAKNVSGPKGKPLPAD